MYIYTYIHNIAQHTCKDKKIYACIFRHYNHEEQVQTYIRKHTLLIYIYSYKHTYMPSY